MNRLTYYVSDQTTEQMWKIIYNDFKEGTTEVDVVKGNECLTIIAKFEGPFLRQYVIGSRGPIMSPTQFGEALMSELVILWRDNP